MDREVEEALAGIRSAWKELLNAKNGNAFAYWDKECRRIERILYNAKRKAYIHFRNTSEEYKKSRRKNPCCIGRPGRKPMFSTEEERKAHLKKYQHEYYLRVTKPNRKKEGGLT